MTWAVYARQSVEKQNSLSIDGQIELCRRTAGSPLAVYEDRGYSGKNTRRPAFQRLLGDVRAGRIEKLFVYRLDRFSRSVADFGRLWETLQANGVEFVSVSENFDTSTPMGRAMLHIIMVFAQLERETTAQRVRDNYYRRAGLGAWPGGPPPYGYAIGRITEGGRTAPALKIVPEQAAAVRRAFEEYARPGATLSSVARRMNEASIPAPRRGAWDGSALSRLLHGPVYVMADREVYLHFTALGAAVTSPAEDFDGVHGLLLVGRRDRAGKRYAPAREQALSVLNSPGIVPAELWLACQRKLGRNAQLKNSGSGAHTWLSGLLKCAACGYSLKVTADGPRRYVHCGGRYSMTGCRAAVRADLDALESAVQDQLQQVLDKCPPASPPASDDTAQRLEELDRRCDRLLDAFSQSGDMSSAALRRALDRLEDQRRAILSAQRRKAARPAPPDRIRFKDLAFEEKKIVARQFLRRIDVGDGCADVYWNI